MSLADAPVVESLITSGSSWNVSFGAKVSVNARRVTRPLTWTSATMATVAVVERTPVAPDAAVTAPWMLGRSTVACSWATPFRKPVAGVNAMLSCQPVASLTSARSATVPDAVCGAGVRRWYAKPTSSWETSRRYTGSPVCSPRVP